MPPVLPAMAIVLPVRASFIGYCTGIMHRKIRSICAFVRKTVNRLGLDVDGVVGADMSSLSFAESRTLSLDDEDLMFPGVSVSRRRSARFDDEVPHRKRGDSVRGVEHPAYRCTAGSCFSYRNLLDVVDCLDDHDDLQLD